MFGRVRVGLNCQSTLAPSSVNKSCRNQWTILWIRFSWLRPTVALPRDKINHIACHYVVCAKNGLGCSFIPKIFGWPACFAVMLPCSLIMQFTSYIVTLYCMKMEVCESYNARSNNSKIRLHMEITVLFQKRAVNGKRQ